MNADAGQFIHIDATRLHYYSEGSGPLVLLLHGFPETSYSWRHQMTALANAGYRAVAYDQRGYGLSSKFHNPDEYRIGKLVGDAAGLVRALGEETAIIIGHDWGACVAWSAAWTRPDIFTAVAGVSVPFGGRGLIPLPGSPFGEVEPNRLHEDLAGPGQDFYQTYFAQLDQPIAELESDIRGWMRGALFSLSGEGLRSVDIDYSAISPVELIRASALCIPHGTQMKDRFSDASALPTWLSEHDLEVFTSAFQGSGFAGPLMYYRNLNNNWNDLQHMADRPLSVPATLLIGDLDVCYGWGQEAMQRANERIVDYRGTHVLEGCGHWTQQERPDEVNRLLIDFLKALTQD